MPSYSDLADDILISAGYSSDDAARSKYSVLFNIQICIDRVKRERLEKGLSRSGSRGLSSMSTTRTIPVQYEPDLNDRGYFNLPSRVYDIRMNGGIEYITYSVSSGCKDSLMGVMFTLCSPREVSALSKSPLQKPRPSCPYFFRGQYDNGTTLFDDRVWLVGISSGLRNVEVGMYLTVGDIENLDTDAQIDLPDDLLLIVKNMVLGLERWAFAVPLEQLKNDGRSSDLSKRSEPLPPATSSVNAPMLNPTE